MSEDICFEIILEVFFWIAIHVIFEIAVQVLMGAGFSRGEAEGLGVAFIFAVLLMLAAITAYRRKKLGKAVVLDTDGDGEISEEEWAAAGQGEQEVDSGPEQSEGDSGGDGEWWQDKES